MWQFLRFLRSLLPRSAGDDRTIDDLHCEHDALRAQERTNQALIEQLEATLRERHLTPAPSDR